MILRSPISRRRYAINAVGVFVCLIVIWLSVTSATDISKIFLPGIDDVAAAAVRAHSSGQLWQDVAISTLRVTIGFLAALALALPIGMLAGNFRSAEAIVEPFMGFLRYMPVPSFIPLLMLYTGIGETPKILVIFIGAIVQMTLMVADVTRQVSADMLRAGIVLGANSRELFRHIIWPASLPGIFDVIRLNLGWAWTYLTVAEMVAANEGLGFRILKAQRFLQTDIIFLYLLVIGLLGILFDLAIRNLQRYFFSWSDQGLRR